MEKLTRTASFAPHDETQYSPISPEPRQTQRRRLLTRRNLALLLLALSLALFCAIFFPIYFTRKHSRHSSESLTSSSGSNTVTTAQSRTTPGAVWQQAEKFSDLNDFRIEYYSSGQNNSKVLQGLPNSVWSGKAPGSSKRRRRNGGKAYVMPGGRGMRRPRKAVKRQDPSSTSTHRSTHTSSSTSTRSSTSTSLTTTTSSTSATVPTSTPKAPGSVLSIFYPAHSYTPSADPVGGTQFYAVTPFDLTLAASVTFNYSVFLPAYYEFVLGGKMPGLYGGTEGCGGGNDASACWSTRMAWRTDGLGELYAYLPQDKQNTTAMLQVPPYSYVNADYGISLGRGAFNYSRAGWTDISQTITLQTNNTHPNGIVEITVNGSTVIYYDQVYYPTTIKGILFSTFFGGSTSDWATPVDQYSYFRDFGVRINALRSTKKRSTKA